VWVLKEQMSSRGTSGPAPMDYSPAAKFGEVRFITDFDLPVPPRPDSTISTAWVAAVANFIQECDPENDYIVLTGSPMAIYLVGVVSATVGATLNILVWRRERNEYVVAQVAPMVQMFLNYREFQS
jgi:hypothetical protein